jgi:hypothetical protein
LKSIRLLCILFAAGGMPLPGDTGLFEAIRANDERAVDSLVHDATDADSP